MTTHVDVQNHTAHEFSIEKSVRQAPRHPLPMHRGSRYEFHSALTLRGQGVDLRQQMQGTLLHSNLWCAAADHPWYDDEGWHTYRWASPRGPIEIVYRSYGTGGDNDIEYVLNPLWPPNPTSDTFNVLACNVYMRPHLLLKNGQYIRARLLPPRIDDYDVLVLSEVFDDAVRERLVEGLRPTYPHRTLVAGLDRAWEQDGGVMIVSRWPIQVRDRLSFHDQQLRPITDCRGDDCHADKGVVYARIGRQERTFHVFGTHLQAGPSRDDALVYLARVVITSDDVEGLPVEFHAVVTAEVIVPDMAVLPMSIAFGQVAVGRQVTHNVVITNYGSAPLLFRVEPPARTGLPAFTWSGDEIGTRRVLRPGEDLVVAVRFQPPGPVRYSARLTVTGADGTAHVALSGEGLR